MAFYMRYGMGGGYGGAGDWELCEATNQKDADEWAYELACQDFESSGEFDYEQYEEDYPDSDESEQWVAYCEERESWIEHEAIESDLTLEELN